LYNGLGRYETALARAQQASEQAPELFESMWALAELIEAASRTGPSGLATDALARLAEATNEISSRLQLQRALRDGASATPTA
jgi:hypothetical protein